jgi:hypothetical protein
MDRRIEHAEVHGGVAGCAHGLEFLGGGCHGGFDRGDLALLLGLLESIGEVGVDFLQSRELGRVDPKEWASDTRFSALRA